MNRPMSADTLRAAEAGIAVAPATTFLREYFRDTKGPLYLTVLRNGKSKLLPEGELANLLTRMPDDVVKFLADHDRPEKECGIYYCTATLKDGSTRRKEADCRQFISLFADTDDKNHTLTRDQASEALEAMESPPTLIVDSGHGLQPHWLLSEPCEDAARIIAARKKLQQLVASDEVHNASRVMRLPGSHNSKEGDWIAVQVVSQHPERRYTLEALEEWLDTAPVAIPSKPKEKPKATGNGAAHGKPFIVPSVGTGTDHKRGVAWAAKALEESYRELANTGEGARHNILLKKAYRMGTMVARGWVDTVAVHRALLAAAEACGLIKDEGRAHFEKTFADGIKNGMAMLHPDLPNDGPPHSGPSDRLRDTAASIASDDNDEQGPENQTLHWHGEADPRASRPYLVQDLIPQVGCGLMSGQWGTYKTFTLFDLAHSIMAGAPFIGFEIVRRGGILFFALEGTDEVPVRLQGAIDHKGHWPAGQRAPFAWSTTCPRLIDKNAVDDLVKLAEQAAARLQAEFNLPLVMICIDTVIAGAGYTKDGQDNDTASGQAVMNTLKQVARRTNTFVIGVDHFGKDVSTGTRGNSVKEGTADVVLALLGDKSISGNVINTRLALRKRRGGANGQEIPFNPRVVDMGTDERGRPMTTLVIDWNAAASPTAAKADIRWTKSLRLLRQALMNVLVDHGRDTRPFPDGPSVRGVDVDIVRQEFYRSYLAEGDTEAKKQDARKKAFSRASKDAQAKALIQMRVIEGATVVWLTTPENVAA